MSKCSVGAHLDEECDNGSSQPSSRSGTGTVTGYISITDLEDSSVELLALRSNIPVTELTTAESTLCIGHQYIYLENYKRSQKTCCDPNNCHKKKRTRNLRDVTVELSKKLREKEITIGPGQKLCTNCRIEMTKLIESLSPKSSDLDSEFSEISTLEQSSAREDLDITMEATDQTPVKLHGMPKRARKAYGKLKLEKTKASLKRKLSSALDCELSVSSDSEERQNVTMLRVKANDFDCIIAQMKRKLEDPGTAYREKVQLLTLLPTTWSQYKPMKIFGCITEHIARTAKSLASSSGPHSLPPPRKGRPLATDVSLLVKTFYQDDEFTRLMPGMKDTVTVKGQGVVQKRLILCNLKELYQEFKERNDQINIGFSKFSALRPKWCILAGSSGTHSVCVCTIHQNVVLLLHAADMDETYKDLIAICVCDVSSKECMLGRCTSCPGRPRLEEILIGKFEDVEDVIDFKQWTSTDRTDLITRTSSVREYIDLLTAKIVALIPHSFISKSQSGHLKEQKENLTVHEAIITMDFSENYSFRIQDEAQGYHWTHQSCTIHPVVIYFNEQGSIKSHSVCFLSNDMDHDVAMVYMIQTRCMEIIKAKWPAINDVEYFTDGCAAQYKNKKSFLNLCKHEEDFGIKAKWSFFATSHGKGPCDGLGGTVKRVTTKASLQRPLNDQITDPKKMFEFCARNIAGIDFEFIEDTQMHVLRETLATRFSETEVVRGTRSFHSFTPLSNTCIATKRISRDEKYSLVFYFDKKFEFKFLQSVQPGSYVAAVYDDEWYIAIVEEICLEDGDALLQFMHPKGPSTAFRWPVNEDQCWVPLDHILCPISPPQASPRERKFTLASDDARSIRREWMSFCSRHA